MSLATWGVYLLSILLIAVSPGPMAMLSISHGLHFGIKRSVATALGSVCAALLLMLASIIGLSNLLSHYEYGFEILKWGGAIYLFILGLKLLFTPAVSKQPVDNEAPVKQRPRLFQQAFLVGISNPKDLLFFAALFPQFIDPTQAHAPQLIILAATWAVVDFSFVMIYAAFANHFRTQFQHSTRRHWLDRISGGVFISLATLLTFNNR